MSKNDKPKTSIEKVKEVEKSPYVKKGIHLVQARRRNVSGDEVDVIMPIKRFAVETSTQDILKWIKNNQLELFDLLSEHTTNKDGICTAKGLMIIRITWKGGVQEQRSVKLTD